MSNAPICWDHVGERILWRGPEMIEETNVKSSSSPGESLRKLRLARRVTTDRHRRALESSQCEQCLSLERINLHWSQCFCINGKLSPRFIGLFRRGLSYTEGKPDSYSRPSGTESMMNKNDPFCQNPLEDLIPTGRVLGNRGVILTILSHYSSMNLSSGSCGEEQDDDVIKEEMG
ncbi:hypothetical protein Tco_0817909 [Tanacetum coccineum]